MAHRSSASPLRAHLDSQARGDRPAARSRRAGDVEPSAAIDDNFEVELPDNFERPAAANSAVMSGPPSNPIAAATEKQQGGNLPPVIVQKSGVSRTGVFFLALTANLFLLATILAIGYFFPRQSHELLHLATTHLKTGGDSGAVPIFAPSGIDPKARIELLELEDRAVFRGDRTAYAELIRQSQTLDRLNPLFDSVHASLIRIHTIYQINTGPTPSPLQAHEILPGTRSEPELPAESLIQVMRDRRHESESRRRAAYLLANMKTPAAQKALYNTIQDDPNLNVVAQAFRSFQLSTGYPGKNPFDTDSVESWWFQNAATFLGQN